MKIRIYVSCYLIMNLMKISTRTLILMTADEDQRDDGEQMSGMILIINGVIMIEMATEIDDIVQLLLMTRTWMVVVKQDHGMQDQICKSFQKVKYGEWWTAS